MIELVDQPAHALLGVAAHRVGGAQLRREGVDDSQGGGEAGCEVAFALAGTPAAEHRLRERRDEPLRVAERSRGARPA